VTAKETARRPRDCGRATFLVALLVEKVEYDVIVAHRYGRNKSVRAENLHVGNEVNQKYVRNSLSLDIVTASKLEPFRFIGEESTCSPAASGARGIATPFVTGSKNPLWKAARHNRVE
jgi:hypothetical protein